MLVLIHENKYYPYTDTSQMKDHGQQQLSAPTTAFPDKDKRPNKLEEVENCSSPFYFSLFPPQFSKILQR